MTKQQNDPVEQIAEWFIKTLFSPKQAASRHQRITRNGGHTTKEQWQEIMKFYDYHCLCCRRLTRPGLLTMDHVIPLSHGGKSSPDNIQPLCFECNRAKGVDHTDYRIFYKPALVGRARKWH